MEEKQYGTTLGSEVPQVIVTPPLAPPVEQKPTSPLKWLLVILFLVLLSAILYLGYQNMQLKKLISDTTAPPPPAPDTQTVDPMANLKTYTNNTYGFQIGYPREWIVLVDAKSQDKELTLQTANGEFVHIVVFDILGDSSKDNDFRKTYKMPGNKSLLITYVECDGPGCGYGKLDVETFSKILTTFKFTDQDTSVDGTYNWEIYSNKKSHFEFLHHVSLKVIETEQGGYLETPSNNTIRFIVSSDTSPTIAEYLVKADKISLTAYEGQPSLEVQSTKKTVINGLNVIQRREYLSAADITRINTYFKNGSTIVSITLVPTPGNSLSEDEATYNQILSDFKFTN